MCYIGGAYAILPAYEADLFGTKYVGAIHGRMLLFSSSAALADAKPKRVAISARVGGRPLSSIALVISSKISLWRGVSLGRAASSSGKSTVFMSML